MPVTDPTTLALQARAKRTEPTKAMILRKLGFCPEKQEGDAY